MIQDVQYRIKITSTNFVLFTFKLLSGLFWGLALAIIGQEFIKYGEIVYWFAHLLTVAVFLRISKDWGAWGVVIFNLVCVLVGMLLRMYILIAPGE